jgi:putative oxidoreductase
MNLLDRMEPWAEPKRQAWFDYLRIILGLFIVYKGVIFTMDIPQLQEMSRTVSTMTSAFLSTFILAVHLIGGALLTLGLFTRWMCFLQLPILFGAVFFVNLPQGSGSSAELIISLIVLIGLCFFFVFGTGEYSIDEIRRRDKKRMDDLAH